MNEDQIERRVERAIDALDKRFMSDANAMTQDDYDREVSIIDKWAQQQYDALGSAPVAALDRRMDY